MKYGLGMEMLQFTGAWSEIDLEYQKMGSLAVPAECRKRICNDLEESRTTIQEAPCMDISRRTAVGLQCMLRA